MGYKCEQQGKNLILAVASGKGGVGKTTVTVNLAYSFYLTGKRVGILDTDIHGPNTAKMLGIEECRLTGSRDGGIEPVYVYPTLKVVSIAFALENKDQPVIWRGPLKMATIKQFLSDVNWGTLDYMIVDSPPGTGDEPLSVCQLIPGLSGAIIVTTPQDLATLDARKSIMFAKQLNVPVIGVIENMSGFSCPHCGGEISILLRGGESKVPIYEYRCTRCGTVSEFLVGVGKKQAKIRCEHCGSMEMEKLFSESHMLKTGAHGLARGGHTCCGREERCSTPPCESGQVCERG